MIPKHFNSYKSFTEYIHYLALHDRENYLESIIPTYGEPSKEDQQWVDETRLEITAIKRRLKKLSA